MAGNAGMAGTAGTGAPLCCGMKAIWWRLNAAIRYESGSSYNPFLLSCFRWALEFWAYTIRACGWLTGCCCHQSCSSIAARRFTYNTNRQDCRSVRRTVICPFDYRLLWCARPSLHLFVHRSVLLCFCAVECWPLDDWLHEYLPDCLYVFLFLSDFWAFWVQNRPIV